VTGLPAGERDADRGVRRLSSFGGHRWFDGGDVNGGGGAWGNRDVQREGAAVDAPGAGDRAAEGVVVGGGGGQPAAGPGMDDDVVEAGSLGIDVDSGDVAVEPVADGAEGVVVEGVHAWVLEAVLLGPAIPALPDGGGAVLEGIAPGWERVVEEETVGDVEVAGVGKDGEEEADASEAGGQVPIVLDDVFDQVLGRDGTEVVWKEIDV